jgi:hypothetical protein
VVGLGICRSASEAVCRPGRSRPAALCLAGSTPPEGSPPARSLMTGRPLPSITTLSQELGHARMTYGKALQLLEQEEAVDSGARARLLRREDI